MAILFLMELWTPRVFFFMSIKKIPPFFRLLFPKNVYQLQLSVPLVTTLPIVMEINYINDHSSEVPII